MKLSSAYKKASSALKGIVIVGFVNADGNQYLGGQGFPNRQDIRGPRETEVPRFQLENEYVKVSLDDRFWRLIDVCRPGRCQEDCQ